jgi:glyoxylate carboligase
VRQGVRANGHLLELGTRHARVSHIPPSRSSLQAGVTAFLIDEMFPAAAAEILRTKYGRDAVHVNGVGLRAVDDTQVAATSTSRLACWLSACQPGALGWPG